MNAGAAPCVAELCHQQLQNGNCVQVELIDCERNSEDEEEEEEEA